MGIARYPHPRKHDDRPPACSTCGSAAWWDGWREVTGRHLGSSGYVEIRPGQRLHRATCSSRGCSAPSWTLYPTGRYPSRRFDLGVVVTAVANGVYGRDAEDRPVTRAVTGRQYACSGRSVSRWTRWIAELTDVEALARTCTRIDPDGMPAAVRPETSDSRARAGRALAVFDRFASLLEKRNVLAPGNEPSLVRILDDQRLRHGACFPLRGLSPPSSTGTAQTVPHG